MIMDVGIILVDRLLFQLPPIPDGVSRFRFRLQLGTGDFSFCYAENDGTTEFNCTISELSPDSTYRVLVRVDVLFSVCSRTGYLYGNNSRYIAARTSAPRGILFGVHGFTMILSLPLSFCFT